MKNKIALYGYVLIFILALGFVSARTADELFTMDKSFCPMKSFAVFTASESIDNECCCKECCKDGKCSKDGDCCKSCCKDSDSCPLKKPNEGKSGDNEKGGCCEQGGSCCKNCGCCKKSR